MSEFGGFPKFQHTLTLDKQMLSTSDFKFKSEDSI